MLFKGTRGEWRAVESYDKKYKQACININVGEHIEGLATVWSASDELCESTKADARLIAAAPAMLEMLQEIADKFDKDQHLLNVSPTKIKELIKKIEG